MYIAKRSKRSFPFKHECKIIGLALSAVIVFISLYSYNPHDRSWFFYSSQQQDITNQCGLIGAQVSGLLMYLFGLASFLCVPFLLFIVYLEIQRRSWEKEWERIACFGLLIVTTASLCNMHHIDLYYTPIMGGYIGYMVTSFLYRLFDYIGALLLLYTALHICLVVLFRFSFIHVIQYGLVKLRALYALMIQYRVLPIIYNACQTILYYLIVRPVMLFAQFSMHLLDGSAFEGTGMRAQEDTVDIDEPFYVPYVMKEQVKVAKPIQVQSSAPTVNNSIVSSPTVETSTVYEERDFNDFNIDEDVSKEAMYGLPSLDIFIGVNEKKEDVIYRQELQDRAGILEEKLRRFGISGKVTSIKNGPVVTLFEYQPEIDTKISKILALEDDLALALQALSIRIIAPIPGRSVVGFEVSNRDRKDVLLAQVIKSVEFQEFSGSLPLILGVDTIGNNEIVDLVKMPHLLIAGSTGSGKSVALNSMLISLLCKCTPAELKLILIDPKRLEFASYDDIAHLLFPIITDPKRVGPILRWVVNQMEFRYEKMAHYGVRNIFDFNKIATRHAEEPFPFIVVVVDELSDLMLTVGREIEDLITRITQMARAAGIHMIIATQRPSVDVITGLIKVNFPSRISFRVTSKADSRTILDRGGADKLLGRGDSLFLDSTTSTLKRIHGAYVSDNEIEEVVTHIHAQQAVEYLDINEVLREKEESISHEDEELLQQVLEFLQEVEEVSISLLQRKFRIGYNRSARIIEILESRGLIMPPDGSKARRVIRSQ